MMHLAQDAVLHTSTFTTNCSAGLRLVFVTKQLEECAVAL